MLCENKFMSDYISFSTKGLTIRFDGTPMRVYVDGVLQPSIETFWGVLLFTQLQPALSNFYQFSHARKLAPLAVFCLLFDWGD